MPWWLCLDFVSLYLILQTVLPNHVIWYQMLTFHQCTPHLIRFISNHWFTNIQHLEFAFPSTLPFILPNLWCYSDILHLTNQLEGQLPFSRSAAGCHKGVVGDEVWQNVHLFCPQASFCWSIILNGQSMIDRGSTTWALVKHRILKCSHHVLNLIYLRKEMRNTMQYQANKSCDSFCNLISLPFPSVARVRVLVATPRLLNKYLWLSGRVQSSSQFTH